MSITMKPDKQPWEVLPIQISFADSMAAGESIGVTKSSVTVIDTATGEDVSSALLNGDISVIDETTLLAILKGGVHKKKYKASFKAYISETKQLEEDLIFDVRD